LDDLYALAKKLGIQIIYKDLLNKHSGLLGMADAANKTITLDWLLRGNYRQLKCILAEEIGHILFPPRPGHIRYHSKRFIHADHIDRSLTKAIVAQDERKARQWAANILMPDDEFWRALREGANTVYRLAEWFDVEEWFVLMKIGYVRLQARESGVKLKWRDIIKRDISAWTPEKGL